jgi:ribonuclease P protein component
MPAAAALPTDRRDPPAPPRSRRRLQRLPQRADFLRLQSGGRKQVTPGFILQIADRPEGLAGSHGPRVGFTVTKRVGNAVIRNRVRRRLRALARDVLVPEARDDLDYVLIGRQGTIARDFATMAGEMRKALRRLKADRPAAEAAG